MENDAGQRRLTSIAKRDLASSRCAQIAKRDLAGSRGDPEIGL
jgi:hypothetical protein